MNVEQVKSIDEAMGLAIEHSYQVKGTTYPNPPVGAVIVDPNGRIVGAAAPSRPVAIMPRWWRCAGPADWLPAPSWWSPWNPVTTTARLRHA